jgi:Na+-transporting methylmalonyl-CoA/oxaloacetate decarboxylase gamma subunit
MRKSKEIVFLFVLLIAAMVFVLWYVIDRRAKNRAAPPVAARTLAPEPPPAQPVALGTPETERKTIDFSTGQPVVKDSPEDKAVIDAALKEMAEATKEVTFEARPAKPAPAKP